jgi:WD40 repeat protein
MGYINFAAYAPDGTYIAAIESDTERDRLIIWDASSGAKIQALNLEGEGVFDFACSPDSQTILCGYISDYSCFVTVFQRDGRLFRKITGVALDDDGEYGSDVGFSPDSSVGCAALESGLIHFFRLSDGASLYSLDGFGYSTRVAFMRDGKSLIAAAEDNMSRMISLPTGSTIREFSIPSGEPVIHLCLSPQEDRCFIWDNFSIFEWDMVSSEAVFFTEESDGTPDHNYMPGDISQTGKTLVTGFDGMAVKFFDVDTRSLNREFPTPYTFIENVVFVSDENTVLTVCYDRGVKLWDIKTGTEIRRFSSE